MIDLGDVGRHSDGAVLAHSNFGHVLEDNSLSFPAPCPLPGTTQLAPYVIVGDEAFPLRTNMLRPYPGRNLTGVCGFQISKRGGIVVIVLVLQRRKLCSTTG